MWHWWNRTSSLQRAQALATMGSPWNKQRNCIPLRLLCSRGDRWWNRSKQTSLKPFRLPRHMRSLPNLSVQWTEVLSQKGRLWKTAPAKSKKKCGACFIRFLTPTMKMPPSEMKDHLGSLYSPGQGKQALLQCNSAAYLFRDLLQEKIKWTADVSIVLSRI